MSTGTIGQPSAGESRRRPRRTTRPSPAERDAGRPRRRDADARRPGHRCRRARASRDAGRRRRPPGHHRGHGGRVGDGAGEHRRAVEAAHRRDDADGAHPPDGRLEPDDPVQRRRHPARAGGVGAEGERHQPERHGHGRAGARSARHERRVEHVRRRAVRRAGADQAGGELVEVGLADDDRARRRAAGRRRRRRRRARTPRPGTPAVVGTPATSMLSLTTNGMPYSGSVAGSTPASAAASAQRRVDARRPDQHAGRRAGERGEHRVDDLDRVTPRPTLRRSRDSRQPVGSTVIAGSRAERGEQRGRRRRRRRTPRPASSPSSARPRSCRIGGAGAVAEQQALVAAVVGLAHRRVHAHVGGDAGEHEVGDAVARAAAGRGRWRRTRPCPACR